jgi:hypothetical protein
MRQHCPDNKFVQDVSFLQRQGHTFTERETLKEGTQHNGSFCKLCFCFVCDKPAKECTSWNSTSLSVSACHCHASDTGRDAFMWKGQQYRAKAAQDWVLLNLTMSSRQMIFILPSRKCGWYNKYAHKNFSGIDQKIVITGEDLGLHPVGFLDWCHSCGRVASENDFGKVQARPYVRKPGDIFLGEKTIPFRIVAHDPRQFEKFKDRWAEKEGSGTTNWNYLEAELEEDVFQHRLGKYPTREMILASIPILDADKLPKTGSLCLSKSTTSWGGALS